MKQKYYKITFYVWTVVVFTLTSIPKLHSPVHDSLNVDKLAHFLVYTIFAYLFMKMSVQEKYSQRLKLLCLFAVIIPIFDELHQIPIPGRTFSFFDICADFLGFLVVIIYFKLKYKWSNESIFNSLQWYYQFIMEGWF